MIRALIEAFENLKTHLFFFNGLPRLNYYLHHYIITIAILLLLYSHIHQAPLPGFLKTTGVGWREGARERERERG